MFEAKRDEVTGDADCWSVTPVATGRPIDWQNA
jgi:hypothetical protein